MSGIPPSGDYSDIPDAAFGSGQGQPAFYPQVSNNPNSPAFRNKLLLAMAQASAMRREPGTSAYGNNNNNSSSDSSNFDINGDITNNG